MRQQAGGSRTAHSSSQPVASVPEDGDSAEQLGNAGFKTIPAKLRERMECERRAPSLDDKEAGTESGRRPAGAAPGGRGSRQSSSQAMTRAAL